jgi:hypothetical protein
MEMRTRRLRSTVLVPLALAAALAAPGSAGADSQPVTASVANVLALTVSGPVVLTSLTPGQSSTGSGTLSVVATGPWVLRLSDAAASNAGHLQRTVGSSGETVLTHALDWATSGTGVTGGSGTLSGTATVGASGTLTKTVTTSYTQQVDSDELLAFGSVYGLTVTWTLSAS